MYHFYPHRALFYQTIILKIIVKHSYSISTKINITQNLKVWYNTIKI